MGEHPRSGVGDMAQRPVLDTDVLIDYLRGAGPGRELVAVLARSLGYWVTAVTAFELALGRSYAADPSPVDALLSAPMLTLTRGAGLRGGSVLRELRSDGAEIGIRDAMQAGICLDATLPLVTRNTAHFKRVAGLEALHPDAWPRD